MENFKLEKDINLFCFKADSFPDGIPGAHEKMIAVTKDDAVRNYYGVSYWHDDGILYMAGAELHTGETIPPGCEIYALKKGNYISVFIPDFSKDLSLIEKAFKELLDHPGIDENGCCAECYLPQGANALNAKDVRCMVRLAD
jgi:hypothetical protein